MPISIKAKSGSPEILKQLLFVVAFLFCISLASKASIDFGGLVDTTLQTLVLVLFYFYAPRKFRLLGIILYLLLGAFGLDVFSGGVGWNYMKNTVPAFFFLGFVVAAFIPKPKKYTWQNALTYFLVLHIAILSFGLFGIAKESKELGLLISDAEVLLPAAVVKSLCATLIVFIIQKVRSRFQL